MRPEKTRTIVIVVIDIMSSMSRARERVLAGQGHAGTMAVDPDKGRMLERVGFKCGRALAWPCTGWIP